MEYEQSVNLVKWSKSNSFIISIIVLLISLLLLVMVLGLNLGPLISLEGIPVVELHSQSSWV
jgi:hypothetical protein